MIKRLLEIFKRRQYVTERQKKIVQSDLKKELEDAEKKASYQCNEYKRKNIEIKILKEILEENKNLYSENEIKELYISIMGKTQKH
ncbi:hypothetical protein ACSTS3_10740 [Aquimarina muelleri]|uniref:hypothetical protein n=1 Tax=Aquimarina muelleri TaxID=279356 RepID=UPI003F685F10